METRKQTVRRTQEQILANQRADVERREQRLARQRRPEILDLDTTIAVLDREQLATGGREADALGQAMAYLKELRALLVAEALA